MWWKHIHCVLLFFGCNEAVCLVVGICSCWEIFSGKLLSDLHKLPNTHTKTPLICRWVSVYVSCLSSERLEPIRTSKECLSRGLIVWTAWCISWHSCSCCRRIHWCGCCSIKWFDGLRGLSSHWLTFICCMMVMMMRLRINNFTMVLHVTGWMIAWWRSVSLLMVGAL